MSKIALLLSVFLLGTSAAFAQTNVVAPPGVEEQITVRITPEKPQPGENVTMHVESFSFNIDKAYIEWSVNGAVKLEGAGKTDFSFTTGKLGTVQKVTVTMTTEDRRVITKSYTFAPAKVGLVVEGNTYTPAFYKGKALFSPQSSLKVVAFPELVTQAGYKIPAENLVYTWKVDGKVMQAASGYGKSSFTMEGNLIPRPVSVTAEVSAYGSSLSAVQTIQVEPEDPEIILYENNLLYGIRREEAITTNAVLVAKEAEFVAEPYYLSVDIPESADARYVWTLNGQTVSSLTRPNTIGLENRSGEAGIATLGLSIEHLRKVLQAPSLSVELEFDKAE